METLIQDVRYALRTLAKAPGFTAVAVLSLALGIGANTAIFSIIDALMLRNLPVRDPERLVVFGEGRAAGFSDDIPESVEMISPSALREIRKEKNVFQDASGVLSLPFTLHPFVGASTTQERMTTYLVTGNYFATLGVPASAGRLFSDAEDAPRNAHADIVISYAFWKRRWGKQPSVVGTTMRIADRLFTVIGVAAPEFFGTTVGEAADAWIPYSMLSAVPPFFDQSGNMDQQLYVFGRLRPGVSAAQASAAEAVLLKRLMHQYAGSTSSERDRRAIDRMRVAVNPTGKGLSRLRRNFSMPLRVLMVVVAIVLLIACANVANLLLARATVRQRELAVRMAVGSSRGRVARQLLTESLVLAFSGGAVGVLLAIWGNQILLQLVASGPDVLPLNVDPNVRVFLFTFGVALFTGILFGVAPALRAASVDPHTGLHEGRSGTATRNRMLAGRCVVISQVALSLMLLIGAGLFVRSLRNLLAIDTGFNRRNVLLFRVDSDASGLKQDERLSQFYETVEDRVARVPGVGAASWSMFAFEPGQWTQNVTAEGRPELAVQQKELSLNAVGAAYLQSTGIALLQGRFLRRQDKAGAPKVAVLNQTAAREIFGGASPLGRHIGLGPTAQKFDIEIIGVVKDAKYTGLRGDALLMAFVPFAQTTNFLGNLLVKAEPAGQAAVIAEVRKTIAGLDRNLPVSSVSTMEEQVERSVLTQSVVARLSAFFGALALLLAALGLYGILSYSVSRRINEIGIRMALGARSAGVLWMILRETLVLVGVGVAIGVPIALISSRYIESLLFGLKAVDALSIAAAVAVLALIGLAAGLHPARRASQVDPMVALRYE